jgi:LPPG:FO 2-phospho-L-lactate transferase
MREALAAADAPIVAVSPLVGGRSLKGPTEKFMAWAGLTIDDGSIAAHYEGLVAGLVVDRGSSTGRPSTAGVVLHQTELLMADAQARLRVAAETLDFADELSG